MVAANQQLPSGHCPDLGEPVALEGPGQGDVAAAHDGVGFADGLSPCGEEGFVHRIDGLERPVAVSDDVPVVQVQVGPDPRPGPGLRRVLAALGGLRVTDHPACRFRVDVPFPACRVEHLRELRPVVRLQVLAGHRLAGGPGATLLQSAAADVLSGMSRARRVIPGYEDGHAHAARFQAVSRFLGIRALPEARLEVYRGPAGDGYQSVTHHAAGDEVAPPARPDARIVVDDLLR